MRYRVSVSRGRYLVVLGERERKTGEKICQRGGLGEFQRSADELDRFGSPESEKPTEVVREQGAPGSHQDNELARLRWSPGSIGGWGSLRAH